MATKLFETGAVYPPPSHIPRLACYKRGKTIFDGRHPEIYDRASSLLKDTPHAEQLKTLFIAVNLMDILLTKPADLLTGEPPTYESGTGAGTREQERLDSIVEENDLTLMVHEMVIGAGYRGDSFIKVRYGARADVSETEALAAEYGLTPPTPELEPIIESVRADIVFPELSTGSRKNFKAINIAWVDWVEEPGGKVIRWLGGEAALVPYLVVERHIPGYIVHERYKLTEAGVNNEWGVPISTYLIGDKIATGLFEDVEATGTDRLPVHHIPYKSVDDRWEGINGVEKLESVLSAINERLVQIDLILWKHSDPWMYGPAGTTEEGGEVRGGGRYIEIENGDVTPGYMTWEGQLTSAFTELDVLLGLVYQMSETPQWLFGTTLASDKGGTGTSHTDSGAIKARFMPILAKVNRIRAHVDRALRDAIWTAMQLENYANKDVAGFVKYDPVYPRINWRDGVPIDEKEAAEVAQIRTGGKPTASVHDAIKTLDGVDDAIAAETIARIDADEERTLGTVESTVFNEPAGGAA
ncbi:portal protein [Paenibacillus sp.]|uniref:portal protein n=1 Tax=Paenibacillus sp. TaxID=58172 RepID=UPI0028B15CA8|nr:portal protein [Paenibacillus sp.]